MQSSPILRDNISDALVTAVRHMIVDGRLPAGTRINEVHLSRALGVSRTPLREALARLAQEGALINTPRIGYHAAAPGETAEDLWAHSCGDPECLHADSTCQGLLSPPLPPLFPVRMA